jgi:uncharacterized protein YgbK (DUF1537 family)
MLLGAIADDFTGASDLANTLTKEGMATTQFIGVPGSPAPADCEAGVVALKTRSIRPADAVAQSLKALEWLQAQGCRQFLFKYCSTFDSTPEGNIGPVAEALLDALGAEIAVVCPVFPATGRRLFMGHLFVGDRLLSESGMEKHPLNPMTDPDIRRWLRLQVKGDVGHVDAETVRAGPAAIGQAFARETAAARRLVVVDAISDDDLRAIGTAAAGHRLITGGSGIALGLPDNFRRQGLLSGKGDAVPAVPGRGVVLSGSCSIASRRQVAAYLEGHPGLAVDPSDLASGRIDAAEALRWIAAQGDAEPIVYSTAEPEAVAAAQKAYGREAIAGRIEGFFGDLAKGLAESGYRRVVVGGGETSGAVVAALGIDRLQVGPEIDPGVPVLVTDRGGPFGMALKSGNFGAPDFFAKALARLQQA